MAIALIKPYFAVLQRSVIIASEPAASKRAQGPLDVSFPANIHNRGLSSVVKTTFREVVLIGFSFDCGILKNIISQNPTDPLPDIPICE